MDEYTYGYLKKQKKPGVSAFVHVFDKLKIPETSSASGILR